MSLSKEQLEWIVQEVIRRLLSQGVAVSERVGVAGGERSSTTAELAVNDKVITLRTIEGKLNGVQQLRVPSQAVVTPAVKDELKQRRITLVRLA
jgi:hypothetical protein